MKNRVVLQLTVWGYLLHGLLLLLLPLRWILSGITAAMVHECCHLLAIVLCGKKIAGITVCDTGITMEAEDLLPWQELVCTLAGPTGSLLLVLLIRKLPMLSLCAMVQGCYNLLPIYPLDGGRALLCATRMCWGVKGEEMYRKLRKILLICFFAMISYFLIFA